MRGKEEFDCRDGEKALFEKIFIVFVIVIVHMFAINGWTGQMDSLHATPICQCWKDAAAVLRDGRRILRAALKIKRVANKCQTYWRIYSM